MIATDAVVQSTESGHASNGFVDVLRSECRKLVSVRSTTWTLLVAVVANVGLAAVAGAFLPGQLSEAEKSSFDVMRVTLLGVHLSQVAFTVLGALAMTSEYSTGLIRVSLSAVPGRGRLLAAKAVVVTGVCLSAGLLSSVAAFFAFQSLNSEPTLDRSLADAGILRAVCGGGLYLTAAALLALGVGAAVRSSSAALSGALALLFVPPILLQFLPHAWQANVEPYIPMDAGSGLYALHTHDGAFSPWTGFGIFLAYTTAAGLAGLLVITRRDA